MASRGENADFVSSRQYLKGLTNENPRHRGRIASYLTVAYNNTLSDKALRFHSESAAAANS
jgi:sarcosine oxidase delta subunit